MHSTPCQELSRRKQISTAWRKLQNHKTLEIPMSQKPSDLQKLDAHSNKCTRCGDTLHAKGFQCPARKFQCKMCHKFGHFTTVCYQKSQQSSNSFKPRKPKAQQLPAGALYTHHDADQSGSDSDTEESFCLSYDRIVCLDLRSASTDRPVDKSSIFVVYINMGSYVS